MVYSGAQILDATGRRYLTGADGKRDICGACCKPCQYCDGNTPKNMSVVLSGLSPCLECMAADGGQNYSLKWFVPEVEPNGTFLLAQDPGDPCTWRTWLPTDFWYDLYTGRVCAGNPTHLSDPYKGYHVVLSKILSGWTLSAYYNLEDGGEWDMTFRGTATGTACDSAVFSSNSITACRFRWANVGWDLATGGSATAAAV